MIGEESGHDSLFLRACRREPVERTPIWIMRQAGRYLPEYREVRARVDFLTSCRTPEIACELTLQPVRRLGVDAAILFSDILIPLPGMGVAVEFAPGPTLPSPVRSRAAIEALRVPDAREATSYVMEAIRLLRRELPGSVPLIGFAGAPFTVATYLVEGGGSKSFAAVKSLLFSEPDLAHRLLGTCADTIASYLSEQVRAGAQAAMLFDTWAGILSPGDYEEYALPYARRVFEAVERAASERPAGERAALDQLPPLSTLPNSRHPDAPLPPSTPHDPDTGSFRPRASTPPASPPRTESQVNGLVSASRLSLPRIYYAGDSAGHLEMIGHVGADVIGLDWRLDLDAARLRLGESFALQGNLDPAVLLGPRSLIERRAHDVLLRAHGLDRPRAEKDHAADSPSGPSHETLGPECATTGPAIGHVFNLGHGILPDTPPDHALHLVETVHRLSARSS